MRKHQEKTIGHFGNRTPVKSRQGMRRVIISCRAVSGLLVPVRFLVCNKNEMVDSGVVGNPWVVPMSHARCRKGSIVVANRTAIREKRGRGEGGGRGEQNGCLL